MALFFGFDQALFFQRQHIVLHPLDLFTTQTTTLDVDRETRQM